MIDYQEMMARQVAWSLPGVLCVVLSGGRSGLVKVNWWALAQMAKTQSEFGKAHSPTRLMEKKNGSTRRRELQPVRVACMARINSSSRDVPSLCLVRGTALVLSFEL